MGLLLRCFQCSKNRNGQILQRGSKWAAKWGGGAETPWESFENAEPKLNPKGWSLAERFDLPRFQSRFFYFQKNHKLHLCISLPSFMVIVKHQKYHSTSIEEPYASFILDVKLF
jgi:hypothetical protein